MVLCGDFSRGDEENLVEWDQLRTENTLADACELDEGGDKGYTWSRIFAGGRRETNRIYKIYVSRQGYWLAPPFSVHVQREIIGSDHNSLLFDCGVNCLLKKQVKTLFKLNTTHLNDVEFKEKIIGLWQRNPHMSFEEKIVETGTFAGAYGRAKKKASQTTQDKDIQELVRLRLSPISDLSNQESLRLQELEVAVGKRERAKVNGARIQANVKWMNEGDAPTAFFLAKVREKRQEDQILGIKDKDGRWVTEKNAISAVMAEGLQRICGSQEKES